MTPEIHEITVEAQPLAVVAGWTPIALLSKGAPTAEAGSRWKCTSCSSASSRIEPAWVVLRRGESCFAAGAEHEVFCMSQFCRRFWRGAKPNGEQRP